MIEEEKRGATALHEAQALALQQFEKKQERDAAIRHQIEQELNEQQNKAVHLFQERRVLNVNFLVCSALLPGELQRLCAC